MTQPDLTNFYTVFELQLEYNIDYKDLRTKFLALQKQYHPDNLIDESEKLKYVQLSSFINDAYQTLSDELLRAEYLFQLLCHNLNNEKVKINDPVFLMKQLEMRSQVEGLLQNPDFNVYNKLHNQTQQDYKNNIELLASSFYDKNYILVEQTIDKIRFNKKMLTELDLVADKYFS